ncbi:MAG: 25S rRNA (adenine645-N1)-methyltransferase [Cyphobasidiales sp. Tagirdzhanova-0007]|nr:MAG: 25S rRNA (adenine645-N1)-methyltransferase [Cyphobasidiales sp. Tagirdzhanova-0007]
MSLFQTGFAVDSMAPAAEASSSNSSHRVRKRKRGGQDAKDDKVEQAAYAQVNLEKLMKKLAEPEKSRVRRVSKDSQGAMMSGLGTRRSLSGAISPRTASSQGKADMHKKDKKSNTRKTLGHTERAMEPYILDNSAPTQRKERRRTQERLGQFATDQSKSARDRHVRSAAQLATPSVNTADSTKSSSAMTLHQEHASKQSKGILSRHISPVETVDASPAMTTLQCNMRKKLSGARFRWINEQLYTTSGDRAHELMQEDPSMFSEYHSGFRSQASSWPSQPVQLFISSFLASPFRPLIADLGCGDAELARTLSPKGFSVFSYDLVSTNPWVVEAQCTKRVPLPGLEGKRGDEGALMNVVVCCLSLMGEDWLNMIREAKRILRNGGKLQVAEVASRFTDIAAFVELIQQVGFTLISKVTYC